MEINRSESSRVILTLGVLADLFFGAVVTVYMVGMFWYGPVAGGEIRGEGLFTLGLISIGTCLVFVTYLACLIAYRGKRPWIRVPTAFQIAFVSILAISFARDLFLGVRHHVWMLHPDNTWHTEQLFEVVIVLIAVKLILVAAIFRRPGVEIEMMQRRQEWSNQ